MLGNMDFVYAVENAYILTPFTALSLVAEGGASLTFPRRMGIVKVSFGSACSDRRMLTSIP